MGMCWAPDCKHYNARETCRFFKFPKDEKERNRWKKLLRRTVEPGVGAYVCSCHFRDGQKENGPELFDHNKDKAFSRNYIAPVKKPRKVLQPLGSSSNVESVPLEETEPVVNVREPVECHSNVESVPLEETGPMVNVREPVECRSNVESIASKSILLPSLLEAENYFLKKKNEELTKKLEEMSIAFSYQHIANNDKLILLYTGLPSSQEFIRLYNLFKDSKITYYFEWNVNKVTQIDQLLITLMKLRQNYAHEDLAHRFNCCQATISNVVLTWINMLHMVLFKQLMSKIPSRQKNKSCLPSTFSTFANCRIILDCTEIYTSVSRKSMSVQKLTYSSYKHRNTWKGLVGVAPNGVITYLSSLYPGSTSDKKIVAHCGILKEFEAGDLVLADKGFLIRDILPAGINLNIPPFLSTAQFTTEQVYQTQSIARARIHVERAIGRMKCFKILEFIPHTLLPQASTIFQVVGALTNLQYPLIKEVEQYYAE